MLCVLGYVALAWAVRFDMPHGERTASLFYPLDTFSMYAAIPDRRISHLLIRDRQGIAHSIMSFRVFDCADPVADRAVQCAETHDIPYHYEDLMHYIRSHAGAGDSDVDLISRTWQLRPGTQPLHTSDCVIARCKVSR